MGELLKELGDMELELSGGDMEFCGLLELRAAKSRLCCCGVKRKLGGKEPPVPVEAIADR
jgi:hypothetical protein